MNCTVSSLKSAIKIALDQNNVSTQLFATSDVDTLSLDELVESKIADAIRNVELNAPLHLLDGGVTFPDSSQVITWISQQGYGPGSVILPTDFLRLVCFKMSDWDHPVFVPISETDPLYAVQRSRFGGVRGNPQKPVCAIVTRNTGLHLEFYSCAEDADATVAMASYIPLPALTIPSEGDPYYSICEKLRPAVIYYAAYLVALITEPDKAAGLLNISQSLMQ